MSNHMALRYGWRRLQRVMRFGELRVLALAILVAVAAAAAVGLFSDRMRNALEAQSGETLGAALLATGRLALPDAIETLANEAGLKHIEHINFPSLVLSGDKSALAAIKAVPEGYPLLGSLRIADEAFGEVQATAAVPQPGEAWADIRLWTELGLKKGAEVQLGRLTLKITAHLEYEPDRGVGFVDLAPRLLINAADVEASGLLGPGSRVQYTAMLSGKPEALNSIRKSVELPAGLRWITPTEGRPEVRLALSRAGQFLDVAVLAVALLAAVAIALTAQQHGVRLRDEVAVLKCLGAQRKLVIRSQLSSLLMIGSVSIVMGLAAGYAGQEILARLLGSLIPNLELPYPSLAALISPSILAMIMLIGFAAPPILMAADTAPIRVFQRQSEPMRRTGLIWSFAVLAILGMLAWQTSELKLAVAILIGTSICLLLLAALAWVLVRSLSSLRQNGGLGWRFGLGNIVRRRGRSVGQAVALGLGLLALLLVGVVREDLLAAWQDRLPPDTPNVFLINIQTEQLNELQNFFSDQGYAGMKLWPMTRARLVAINGEPVSANNFLDPETQRWINRDFNLSWADAVGWDNKFTEGEWWGPDAHGQALLSAEEYARERLGVQIGDKMTLQFGPEQIEFTIHHFREVQWDSFQPNFFLLTPPGIIEDMPSQWLTSFYLPESNRALLKSLIEQFPNITALDLEAAMNQVREIIDRLVAAIQFMLLFTLLAGVVVLLAAIEGTRSERVRETALLRVMGASNRTLRLGLLSEFATLGLVAGMVAAAAAQGVAWLLATQIFDIPYGFRLDFWLISGVGGALLVATFGWLSLRSVLKTPPTQALQSA